MVLLPLLNILLFIKENHLISTMIPVMVRGFTERIFIQKARTETIICTITTTVQIFIGDYKMNFFMSLLICNQ